MPRMSLPALHIYPILVAVLLPVTFVLTYTIAVLLGHTEMDWPYISDTGTYPPESCIFSQLLNLASLLLGVVVYVRFKLVEEFYVWFWINGRAGKVNAISLYIGWASALGVSVVGNFQETAVFAVHALAAFLAFGVGNAYLWTQVYSSYRLCGYSHGRTLLIVRFALAAVSTYGFIVTTVAGQISMSEFEGDKTKWYPDDPGWTMHVVSTVHEWIMALSFNVFIATCVPEFQKVTLDSPKLVLRVNPNAVSLLQREEVEPGDDPEDDPEGDAYGDLIAADSDLREGRDTTAWPGGGGPNERA